MVRGRGKATTYHNMRVPVQNFCGRDFQVCAGDFLLSFCPFLHCVHWQSD
jgi:hypothetical protein